MNLITIGGEKLEEMLKACGVGKGIAQPMFDVRDSLYVVPKLSWLDKRFLPALRKNLKTLKLDDYIEEEWDCDDFAEAATFLTKANHRKTPKPKDFPRAGFAVGWFSYYCMEVFPPLRHRRNLALAEDDLKRISTVQGDLVLVYFEPQTYQFTPLWEAEVEGIRMVSI